jgi:hypothetical protein
MDVDGPTPTSLKRPQDVTAGQLEGKKKKKKANRD